MEVQNVQGEVLAAAEELQGDGLGHPPHRTLEPLKERRQPVVEHVELGGHETSSRVEGQLRAGMGPFTADDDPHRLRPADQGQQAGQLGHLGFLPDAAVGGRRWCLRRGRQRGDGGAFRFADGPADGVFDGAPAGVLGGKPVQHDVRAGRAGQVGRRVVIGLCFGVEAPA